LNLNRENLIELRKRKFNQYAMPRFLYEKIQEIYPILSYDQNR